MQRSATGLCGGLTVYTATPRPGKIAFDIPVKITFR